MVGQPNQVPPPPRPPAAAAGRSALIERVLELQPLLRRRFELSTKGEAAPSALREVMATATLHQLEVLRTLASRGPLAMHELAELQGITRSSATEVVDRLAERGLVQRGHDPADRRTITVALTEPAMAMVEEVRRMHKATIAAVVDVLDDAELATLIQLMEKVAARGAASVAAPCGAGPA